MSYRTGGLRARLVWWQLHFSSPGGCCHKIVSRLKLDTQHRVIRTREHVGSQHMNIWIGCRTNIYLVVDKFHRSRHRGPFRASSRNYQSSTVEGEVLYGANVLLTTSVWHVSILAKTAWSNGLQVSEVNDSHNKLRNILGLQKYDNGTVKWFGQLDSHTAKES